MKKLFTLVLAALLMLSLLPGCVRPTNPEENSPDFYVCHDNEIWKIPAETTGIALDEDAELTDGTVIDPQTLPTQEGECNAIAEKVQIYDGDGYFLVILDGKQHLIER